MAKRDDIKAMRRSQIFEAATKVIGLNGFHNATINEIAREAGIGKGTVYEYIRKKEDLFMLIAEEGVATLMATVEEVASKTDSPREKLEKMIDAQLDLVERHGMLAKTMAFEMQMIRSESAEVIKDVYEKTFLNELSVMIRGVMEEGRYEDGDVIVLADIIATMCFMWAHVDPIREHAGEVGTYKRIMKKLILNGLTDEEKETGNG